MFVFLGSKINRKDATKYNSMGKLVKCHLPTAEVNSHSTKIQQQDFHINSQPQNDDELELCREKGKIRMNEGNRTNISSNLLYGELVELCDCKSCDRHLEETAYGYNIISSKSMYCF